ncbi:MAG: hypothetical protein OHK0022_05720 [Roseiflexaceae bacterium]
MRNLPTFVHNLSLIAFGLLIIAIGMFAGLLGPHINNANALRAERLMPQTSAELSRSAHGSQVLIEGRISQQNPVQFQDFVAYTREEYQSSSNSGRNNSWVYDGKQTPPLLIDLPDGSISLGDSLYTLDNPPHVWYEPGRRFWNPLTGEGSKRYNGLRAGDPVVVIGRLEHNDTGMELDTHTVYVGTRASYISDRRSMATSAQSTGGFLMMVGAAFAGAGAWRAARSS